MYLNLKRAPLVLSIIFFILLALIAITGTQQPKAEGRIIGDAPSIMVPMGIALGSGIALIVILVFITFSVKEALR